VTFAAQALVPAASTLVSRPAQALVALLGLAICSPAQIKFEDIAARSGIKFVLRDSATPQKHQIEPMVGGVAVLDYNNDGRPDVYFVNGAAQPSLEKSDPSFYNRLYRNNPDGTLNGSTASSAADRIRKMRRSLKLLVTKRLLSTSVIITETLSELLCRNPKYLSQEPSPIRDLT
jgi:hypothetical protein